MPVTYSNVGGAEPSTVTFRAATVAIARGSTTEQQEIIVLGDPQSSLGQARVLSANPVSTEFGLAVRIVSGPSSAADLAVLASGNSTSFQGGAWTVRANLSSTAADNPVAISGNSTVIQGTSPWVISGNSTVIQGTSPWVVSPNSTTFVKNAGFSVDSSNALNVKLDGSTALTIGSIAAGAGRINIGSTAADNAVLISGNSTVFQGTNPWVVSPNSTAWVKNAGLSVDSSNVLNVKMDGSTALTIGSIAAGAGRINIGSTAADNAVLISGNSTAFQGTSPWVISGNSTVIQGTSPWVVSEAMNSSVAPSSASSGVIVRQVVDNILTTASSNVFVSSAFTIQSSAASLRSYVTAYSITSTVGTAVKIAFYSGSTMIWPLCIQAPSSAISGVNLAVSAPSYLFRTKAAGPLSLQTPSSIAGVRAAVSYFRAI